MRPPCHTLPGCRLQSDRALGLQPPCLLPAVRPRPLLAGGPWGPYLPGSHARASGVIPASTLTCSAGRQGELGSSCAPPQGLALTAAACGGDKRDSVKWPGGPRQEVGTLTHRGVTMASRTESSNGSPRTEAGDGCGLPLPTSPSEPGHVPSLLTVPPAGPVAQAGEGLSGCSEKPLRDSWRPQETGPREAGHHCYHWARCSGRGLGPWALAGELASLTCVLVPVTAPHAPGP